MQKKKKKNTFSHLAKRKALTNNSIPRFLKGEFSIKSPFSNSKRQQDKNNNNNNNKTKRNDSNINELSSYRIRYYKFNDYINCKNLEKKEKNQKKKLPIRDHSCWKKSKIMQRGFERFKLI